MDCHTQIPNRNTSWGSFWDGYLLCVLRVPPISQGFDDIKFTHWTRSVIQKPWVNAYSMKNMLAWQDSDNIFDFKVFNTHCTILSININSLLSMLHSV